MPEWPRSYTSDETFHVLDSSNHSPLTTVYTFAKVAIIGSIYLFVHSLTSFSITFSMSEYNSSTEIDQEVHGSVSGSVAGSVDHT
jgi:hypothetical protein